MSQTSRHTNQPVFKFEHSLNANPTIIGCIKNIGFKNASSANDKVESKSVGKASDESLIQQFQNGDTSVFNHLVEKYQSNISRVVSRYIRDLDTAKDVVQETFLRAYLALDKFRFGSKFFTWLHRIAVNTSFYFFRSEKRKYDMVDVDDTLYEGEISEAIQTTGPDKDYQMQELQFAINKALDRLPTEQRTTYILREFDGLSYEQIADIVECKVGTVKSRISRAREHVIAGTKHLYFY